MRVEACDVGQVQASCSKAFLESALNTRRPEAAECAELAAPRLLESESAADHAIPDSRPGAASGGAQGATIEGTRPLARKGPSEKAPPVPVLRALE
jgi:hypothetical protein